jgi:hypothetical protein
MFKVTKIMKDKIPEINLKFTSRIIKPKILYRIQIFGKEMWIEGPLKNIQDN